MLVHGKNIPDFRIFECYDERWEYCTLCNILAHRNWASRDGQGYLCEKHLKLYREEIADEKFPPGLTPAGQEKFAEDEEVWMRLRGLELLVDDGKISKKQAQEEMKLYINLLNDVDPAAEEEQARRLKERREKMMPKTRLY